MNDNRGKKLTVICTCLFMAVVLLTSSFLQKKQLKEETQESKEREESLAKLNAEPEPELYEEGEPVTVYFSNTGQIDKNGALPFRELEMLNEKTQEYLKSRGIEAEELPVITGSLQEKGEWVYFSSRLKDGILTIGFNKNTEQFHFTVEEAGA